MDTRTAPATSRWLLAAIILAQLSTCVQAHVEIEPAPRHSQFSKFYVDNNDVDYNMKSPLGSIDGYPCRNFKTGLTQGTLITGRPLHVQFDGVAKKSKEYFCAVSSAHRKMTLLRLVSKLHMQRTSFATLK
ncbi:hypothetical protein LPJ73_001319 [Coemansia sp. RSA 2703]|nr:hypothetical protein LPJ73_001319 [Coemansia sp. RSA 2703]KAJ2371788.1 hypothetical protein IW150_004433 [Coemansia sp. RSA 2607]